MFNDLKELLSIFRSQSLEYLMVGGYAASLRQAVPEPRPSGSGCSSEVEFPRPHYLCRPS